MIGKAKEMQKQIVKMQNYFITLVEDTQIVQDCNPRCECWCCIKFGYHSARAIHAPTGTVAEGCPVIRHSSYFDLKDPKILAMDALREKLKKSYEKECQENNKDLKREKVSEARGQEGVSKVVFGITNQKLTTDQELCALKLKDAARTLRDHILNIPIGIEAFVEKGVALERLEECVMWAVKGISSLE
jgi:hypothetical protein